MSHGVGHLESMNTRVMVVSDHKTVVEELQRLLEPHFNVVGAATDGVSLMEVLEEAQALRPDVLVLDLAMPLLSGLEAARTLKQILPQVKLILLAMKEDPEPAVEAMREGASGYLVKTAAAAELVQAIDAAMRGKSYVTPKIARGMREWFIRNSEGLTPRQREVLQLLAKGKSMKEAADILGVTPQTLAFHEYTMMDELGVRSTAELIRYAVQLMKIKTDTPF